MADDPKQSNVKHRAFLHEQSRYRARNEDRIFPSTIDDFNISNKNQDNLIFMICDGVSGGVRGDLAAETVCDIFPRVVWDAYASGSVELSDREVLEQALSITEEKIDELVAEDPKRKGMSTTLSYLNLKDGKAVVAWIGDSKVYHVRAKETVEEGIVVHTTDEHTLANRFYKEGKISKKEKATHPYRKMNIRTVAGTDRHADMDVEIWDDIRTGDYLFLCSDGVLDGFLIEKDLVDLVSNRSLTIDEKLKVVNRVCNENSTGNYSMCLIEIGEEEAVIPAAEPTKTIETVSKAAVIPAAKPVVEKIKKQKEEDIFDILVPVLVIGILLVVAFMIWKYASGMQSPDYTIERETEQPKVRMEPNIPPTKEEPSKTIATNMDEPPKTKSSESGNEGNEAGKSNIPTAYNGEIAMITEDEFTEKSPEPLPEKPKKVKKKPRKPKKPKIDPLKKALSQYDEHHLLLPGCYKVKKGADWEVVYWNKKKMEVVIPASLNFTEILDPVNFNGKYISRVRKNDRYGYVLFRGDTSYKLLKGRDGFPFNNYEFAPPKFGSSLCNKYTQVRKIDYAQDGVIILHDDNTLGYTSIVMAAKQCAN